MRIQSKCSCNYVHTNIYTLINTYGFRTRKETRESRGNVWRTRCQSLDPELFINCSVLIFGKDRDRKVVCKPVSCFLSAQCKPEMISISLTSHVSPSSSVRLTEEWDVFCIKQHLGLLQYVQKNLPISWFNLCTRPLVCDKTLRCTMRHLQKAVYVRSQSYSCTRQDINNPYWWNTWVVPQLSLQQWTLFWATLKHAD